MVTRETAPAVRFFAPEYADELVDLFRCCYPTEVWTADDFTRFMEKKPGNNFVKVVTGENDATVYAAILCTLTPTACRIRRLAVWPDYRRQGLGTFAVRYGAGLALHGRRNVFTVGVPERNTAAALLFRDLGFKLDPTCQRRCAADETYYRFTKDKSHGD